MVKHLFDDHIIDGTRLVFIPFRNWSPDRTFVIYVTLSVEREALVGGLVVEVSREAVTNLPAVLNAEETET